MPVFGRPGRELGITPEEELPTIFGRKRRRRTEQVEQEGFGIFGPSAGRRIAEYEGPEFEYVNSIYGPARRKTNPLFPGVGPLTLLPTPIPERDGRARRRARARRQRGGRVSTIFTGSGLGE